VSDGLKGGREDVSDGVNGWVPMIVCVESIVKSPRVKRKIKVKMLYGITTYRITCYFKTVQQAIVYHYLPHLSIG
jgi:hypothetical protein